ncbi:class I SAM-dependent methyltransferase [Aestuariimicrobium ganziense]|uniref:class I SAM-dependent methyltransferase n=1 Tax=Aestuariimicrobium ganziense TaxID=2773677 RepID=UPI001940A116|nr:class I SAM-dependent methyltransferase [Aestuariimicrobium ganziense]
MSLPRYHLPDQAVTWLTAANPLRVLTLGGATLPRVLHRAGHDVFAVDRSPQVVAALADVDGITAVVAQAESLPFQPCQFDVVLSHQDFHRFAPGLVLSEMARVLRPGGRAGVSYLVRDDSVPWVRRLTALVQKIDPAAMAGNYGADSVTHLASSKYFGGLERTQHRHWVPITRTQLLGMVEALPAIQGLAEPDRNKVLDDVARLHDDAAPGADALRLPYLLQCHRAWVDHDELTAPIEIDDDGLVIPL